MPQDAPLAGPAPEWEAALWHLAVLRETLSAALLRRARRIVPPIPAWARMPLRRAGLLVWWSVTLQLPRRAACFRAARRARAAAPAPVLECRPSAPVPAPEAIVLPRAEMPVLSIVITSFGRVDHTLRCLGAIARAAIAVPAEVILLDDASGDPDLARLARVPGLRLVVPPRNLGYLRACNEAARHARGAFLLLLNNDTEIAPGAAEAMLDLLRARPEAGAVGAKLVFPDGRLQEAGGIVWRDGSGWNYGRGDDPSRPEYNYVREVDYCSAAALMLPRALFAALGGFDARFAPAYYEDTDLAFRLRAAGRTVLYQPRAVVVHLEGLSHGTDPGAGIKSFQEANRATFVRRWDQVLATAHYPSGEHVLRAREHARGRQVVLAIDHYVPQPDRDAGSCNILNYLDAMCAAGLVVKFWPQDRCYRRGYTEALQDRGIEVLHGGEPGAFEAYLAAHGGEIDHVLLSRPDVALATLGPLKRHTAARLIYYGHDLHFRRLRLQAQVTGDLQAARQAARTERIERWIWRSVDRVLYPSAEEAITVAGMEPSAVAAAVPAFGFAAFGAPRPPPAGADILFVGGFAHPPNETALLWFAAEILPLVRARVPAARLVVAGSSPGARVRALAGQGAAIHADIASAALRALYQSARVAVVPLRFGAGVKLKTAEALREGTPLVTTAIGAQGLPGLERAVAIAEDPAGFAAAVAALLSDDALWAERCAGQIAYAREQLTIGRLHAGFLAGAGLCAPALAAAA